MTRGGMIYFIAAPMAGLIKIGCSQRPATRLEGLMRWSPVPLTLLATAPGHLIVERRLHHHYLPLYSHREWFRDDPSLRALIAHVDRTGTIPLEDLRALPAAVWRLPDQKPPGGGYISPERRSAIAKRSAAMRRRAREVCSTEARGSA